MKSMDMYILHEAVHKNNSVSGGRVAKKGATQDFFFHFCKNYFFPPKNGQYFHGKKKKVEKKKNLRPPDWLQF